MKRNTLFLSKILVSIILACVAECVFAQIPLQYISGAQSQAMGRTIVSKPLNALDVSFNPAALANFESITSTMSFANTDFGGYNISGGIVIPANQHGAFEVSFYAFREDVQLFDGNAQFSTHSYNPNTAMISYGQYIRKNLAAGLNAKIVYFPFGAPNNDLEDVGIGLGVSILYELPFQQPLIDGLKIGFLIDNLVQPSITVFDQKRKLPREFRILIEKSFRFSNSELDLINNIVRLDESTLINSGESKQYHTYWGLQYNYKFSFFLRSGYLKNNLVWGGGIRINQFILDYSFGDYNKNNFSQSSSFKHYISLSIMLNEVARTF